MQTMVNHRTFCRCRFIWYDFESIYIGVDSTLLDYYSIHFVSSSLPFLQPRLRSLRAIAISFPFFIDRICFDLAYIRAAVAIFPLLVRPVLPLRFLFSCLLPARPRCKRNDKSIIFFAIFHIGFIALGAFRCSVEAANEFAALRHKAQKAKLLCH